MPAKLLPNEAITELAVRVDSPAMLVVLRLLNLRGFIMNGTEMDQETLVHLKRLAELDLVDPGYAESTNGEPFIWVGNHNGKRVLKHFETNRRYSAQSPSPCSYHSGNSL